MLPQTASWSCTGAIVVAMMFPIGGSGQEHRDIIASKFQEQLESVAARTPGVLGIYIIDLETDARFGVNEELVFPQASAIKVALLATLYALDEAGELSVDDAVTVRASDRAGGSGLLNHFGDGTSTMSLHDLTVPMIVLSDNMATNILVDQVGMESVNQFMRELGFPSIRFQRKMIRPEESVRGNENLAKPLEAASFMARILRCDLPISPARCDAMRHLLELRRPADSAPSQEPVPRNVRVASKYGSLTGVRTEWGAVDLPGRPYALAVMGNYSESGLVLEAIRDVARLSYEYFSRLAGATDHGVRVPPELLQPSDSLGGH